MFRIGSLLFIPAYLTVTLYRPLASPDDDGNPILMAGKTHLSAVNDLLTNCVFFKLWCSARESRLY